MRFGSVLLALSLALLPLFLFGCLTHVDQPDKFSSDLSQPVVYNFSRYAIPKAPDPTIEPQASCTAMVCGQNTSFWKSFFNTLLPGRWLEFSLSGSYCQFIRTNTSQYADLISAFAAQGGSNCNLINPLSAVKEEKICEPQFFMLGQGSSAGDYARAQMYCAGGLKMPVIWAVPNATTGKLDQNVSAARLACYLDKNQMPLIVWYSGGQYINTPEYSKMARSFNTPKGSPALSGPVMLTTEAFLEPLMANPADPAGARVLNFTALDKTADQIRSLKQSCPDCMSVLALKPVFDNASRPDLCALDYLLSSPDSPARPDGCGPEYGAQAGLMGSPQGLWNKTDLIGVGFIANDETDLPSCSLEGDIGRYLSYSRAALRQFYKPGVWYAVGLAAGPTATPDCPDISEADLSNAYDALTGYVPALVSSGIVGVAPYRFGDDPAGLPMRLNTGQWIFNSTSSSLEPVRQFQGGTLVLNSADETRAAGVARYVPEQSDSGRAVFLGTDGNVYAAELGPDGNVEVYVLASHFGFFNPDGGAHPSAYTWFSSCQYYTSNRAPLFGVNDEMDALVEGAHLSSPDGQFSVDVGSIQSAGDNETLFYGDDGRAYAARPDGTGIKIYERPITDEAPLQPLIYSANGIGAQCTALETTKMYARIAVRSNDVGPAYNLTVSRNPEELGRIGALSCGGGACLTANPMPQAFCRATVAAGRTSFPASACTQYAQIDAAFGGQNLDELAGRALAVGESGLGGSANPDPRGAGAPACAISYKAGGCGGPQTAAGLTPYANAYCTVIDLQTKVRQVGSGNLCAYGLMQCTDAPGSVGACGGASYNPFDPADSACCGAVKFNNYMAGARTLLDALRAANPSIALEVSDTNEDWYAAELGAYAYYHGPGLFISLRSKLAAFDPIPSGGQATFAEWVSQVYGDDYGLALVRRYNNALKTCSSSCSSAWTDCTLTRTPVSGSGTGGVIGP